jgi:NAD(P)-dependent dehydrogenase (short-subunit alcohol dehydrogenase family)
MTRLDNKVALITGAARGQGRSHAVHMAAEGADVIALDICGDIASTPQPLATEADLQETRCLVEEAGRRIVTAKVDVRDRAQITAALDSAVTELGGLDVIVANAGISAFGPTVPVQGFVDAFDSPPRAPTSSSWAGTENKAPRCAITCWSAGRETCSGKRVM